MNTEKIDLDTAREEAPSDETQQDAKGRGRQQSTIQFPYGDLESAISVVKAIVHEAGGMPVEAETLAAYLGHDSKSGPFRQKLGTARLFGLVETDRGKTTATDLGWAIVDSSRERRAKVDAFLNVPLYNKVYDAFKSKQLPPRPAALERAFVEFGVALKQKDKARHAFDRSAEQAGFFEHGKDRLIMPPVGEGVRRERTPDASAGGGDSGDGGDGGDRLNLDPLIEGLLRRMPEPTKKWNVADRARWVRTFVMNLSFIYEDNVDDDTIEVSVSKKQRDEQRDE